jgi:glutathione S-transferase
MITLYSGGNLFGLPETSPYVGKTEVQLQLAGLDYVKLPSRPDASPKGQLPFIDDDGVVIADSTFIRFHIERKYGVDLDPDLDAAGRAQAWAVERMVENHLGWVSAWFRFMLPHNFQKGPGTWFEDVPEPKRTELREWLLGQIGINLKAVGIGRHAPDEILLLGERSLAALSTLLGDKPFLYGDRPQGSEAIVFHILAAIVMDFFDSPLRDKAQGYSNLGAYVGRMMGRFYPQHPFAG